VILLTSRPWLLDSSNPCWNEGVLRVLFFARHPSRDARIHRPGRAIVIGVMAVILLTFHPWSLDSSNPCWNDGVVRGLFCSSSWQGCRDPSSMEGGCYECDYCLYHHLS